MEKLLRLVGFCGMTLLLALACGMDGSPLWMQQPDPAQAPAPNWTQPTPDELREAAEADRKEARAPHKDEIAFSFTLATSARATSAAVYDAQSKLVRTLWSVRPYPAGSHHAIWDGRDDYGNPAPAGSYTIKVLAGNVHYDWEGEIGVTEDSLAGPHNWDATASFPNSLTFLDGKAYVAGGYNEGKIEAFVFDEKTPFTVAPLNMALFTGGQFEDAATDGQRIYFASTHYCCNGSNAVVAFAPDGTPWSFPQGQVIPQMDHYGAYFANPRMNPRPVLRDLRGVDISSYKDAMITGLAVQRNGNLLASAHGARGGASPVASLDTILLWDKVSGAPLGKITGITSPQKMVFDRNGDLWVIEGGPTVEWYWDRGAKLVRIHGAGSQNTVTEPFQGLANPVDVAMNPVNGHIFVADGGSSQQVKEFDPATGRLLSTLGTPGGYGQGARCDANITPTKFWLDFNGRSTGLTHPWIAIDEGGDLWAGDFTANRMLRFHQGNLATEIEMGRWNYLVSVPSNDPTRVFSGWSGMIEYKVDYGLPLGTTDSLDPRAPHSWKAVRNWLPCFLEAEAGQQSSTVARLLNVEKFKNGQTIGIVNYHGGPFGLKNALVNLPESGKITFVNNRITTYRNVGFDPQGNFYHLQRTGPAGNETYTIQRFAVTGFDAQGFPEWDNGTSIASVTPDLARGNPYPDCWADGCTFMPSDGGIIPIYAGLGFNKTVAYGDPAFHLGGLPVHGAALEWQTMPEKPILYPDGRGTYSALRNRNEGNEARAIHHDIFASANGNWQEFSCQFFHYRDDGLLVGQFGWRGQPVYRGMSWGRPDPWNGQALAPGFCGNPIAFKIVDVGKDYYIYVPDEGYRAGLQRWRISNLESIYELTGQAALGATVQLAVKH
jgi:hypothetical protein